MNRKASGKSEGLILEDVSRGECDFDTSDAIQGRKVGTDVFYVCKHHKNLLETK